MSAGRYDTPHYHTYVIQDGMVVYDYTDLWPVEAIKQFSCVMSMLDDYTYRECGIEVGSHFLESEVEGLNPYYMVAGLFMLEGVFKCHMPCRISPSMN